MKKLSFLALAAVGLLLGACADKDDVSQKGDSLDEFENGAYIGIALSLPSADNTVTRANDDLSNGIEDEFKVPALHESVSFGKDGKLHITLANLFFLRELQFEGHYRRKYKR